MESQLNNAQNKTTGHTPFRSLHGYYPSFHDGALRHMTTEETYTDVEELRERVSARIEEEQRNWKQRYDKKHVRPAKYSIGEIVFLRRPAIYTGESTKLQSKFRGPLVVTKILPNDVYQVADVESK